MWNNVFILALDDRGAPLKSCLMAYQKRYNVSLKNIINFRFIYDKITGHELSDVTINDKLIVISHADPKYLKCFGRGLMTPFEFVVLLTDLGLKEVGIISFKCCKLGSKSYLQDIKDELFSDILVGYMSGYKKSAVTIFGHEGIGFIDSLIRLLTGGWGKLPDKYRVKIIRGNAEANRHPRRWARYN